MRADATLAAAPARAPARVDQGGRLRAASGVTLSFEHSQLLGIASQQLPRAAVLCRDGLPRLAPTHYSETVAVVAALGRHVHRQV